MVILLVCAAGESGAWGATIYESPEKQRHYYDIEVPELAQTLTTDPSSQDRVEAAWVLGPQRWEGQWVPGGPPQRQARIQALRASVERDPDPFVQLAAAMTLAEFFDPDTVPLYVPVIRQAIDRQKALVQGDGPIFFDFYGQTRSLDLVFYGLWFAGERGGSELLDYWLASLRDEHAAVRAAATIGFDGHHWASEPRAEEALWTLLRHDPSLEVRERAGWMLGSRQAYGQASGAEFFLSLLEQETEPATRMVMPMMKLRMAEGSRSVRTWRKKRRNTSWT